MEMQEKNNVKGKYFAIYLTDFLKGAKKFWWICLILAIILGGYRLVDGYRSYSPVYTSSVTFTISTQDNTASVGGISAYSFYYDTTTASQMTETFPYILKSEILQEAICNDMDLEYLPASLSATSVSGSNLFTLSATGADPQITYDVLLSAMENYPDAAKFVVGNIKLDILENPTVATSPSNKHNYFENSLEGAAIGIIIGLFVILLYAFLRKTIRTSDDIKRELNLESFGAIPKVSFKRFVKAEDRKVLFTNPNIDSEFLEHYRIIRNVFVNSAGDNKVFMVTSTAPDEGKTTTIVNLALSLAALGKKILLVDMDIYHPSLLNTLGITGKELESKKQKDLKLSDNAYKKIYLDNQIDVLLFDTDAQKRKVYIDSTNLCEVFQASREEYDYILVDTPPCGLVSDAMFVAQQVDGVIYVIYQDHVRTSKIRSGIDNLLSTDAKIVGAILNAVDTRGLAHGYGYGYGYGYRYGYGKKSKKRKD